MKITPDLLRKYQDGHCTPAETTAIEQWLDRDESGNTDFPFEERAEAIRQEIWQQLNPAKQKGGSRVWIGFRRMRVAMVAAVILIVAAVSWLLYGTKNSSLAISPVAAITWKTNSTGRGQHQQLLLPDGTRLWLHHESTVRYPSVFTDSVRAIYITGEVYLQVAAAAAKPFMVHTPATTITVLGTAFNVQAYPNDNHTTVTVEEGRIAFQPANGRQQVILGAGQQGHYTLNGRIHLRNVYAPAFLAWKENKLVLTDKTLPEIAVILGRWYNVNITIGNNSLRNEHFTGEFENSSLEQVLKEIAFVIKCRYKMEENKIIIF